MKIEFPQPKNCLTVNFVQTYPQSNLYFHKIHLLLKLPLSNISQRNTVRIRTDEQNVWDKKCIVIKQNNRPRSYDVLNENGNVIIRNRWHLIPTNEKFTEKLEIEICHLTQLSFPPFSQSLLSKLTLTCQECLQINFNFVSLFIT